VQYLSVLVFYVLSTGELVSKVSKDRTGFISSSSAVDPRYEGTQLFEGFYPTPRR